jgi:hypothetical protein
MEKLYGRFYHGYYKYLNIFLFSSENKIVSNKIWKNSMIGFIIVNINI